MNQNQKRFFLVVLILLIPAAGMVGYGLYVKNSQSQSGEGLPVVDWQLYKELDLTKNESSENLKKFDGQRIRSPGFMVPLEDNKSDVTEFLLVPNPQACIHVPPPPANQMVLVRMIEGRTTKMAYGPIWVEGVLRIAAGQHTYGSASFQMIAERTEPYKVEY